MNVEIDTGAGHNVMPLYKVQELFGQECLVQKLSPPTVRIKAYSNQEANVMGSIVLYMYTSEKTDRVIWQVTNTIGVPILGRTQAKLMNYISCPEINAPPGQEQSPVSTDSLKSTDYMYSLETMNSSQQSTKIAQSMGSIKTTPTTDQTAQEHRAATKVKSSTMHEPKSAQVSRGKSSVTINGKNHPLPTTKEYILHKYADVFKGMETLPRGPYHIKLKDL